MSGRIKQTLCWWCFAQSTEPEKIVEEAVALGIQGIEIAPPEHWDMIKAAGLKIIGIGGHGTFSEGLNRKENHDRIEEELRQNIELAAENGIRNLICFSGNHAGLPDDERESALVMEEKGIPVMHYETSHAGSRTDFDENRLLDQLDTFMEMQGLRKLEE